MKRMFISLLLFVLIFLSSCELINDNLNNNSDDSKDLNDIFNDYSDLDKLTVIEQTIAIDKQGNELISNRTTDIDLLSSYTYSKIDFGNDSGFIYQSNNDFYYKLGNNNGKINYVDTKNIFRSLGFSRLFTLNDFSIKDEIAKKNIVSPTTQDFTVLFDNVNFDLMTSHKYNPSILRVEIKLDDDKIEYIKFDLSLIFGSFYESVVRKITFDTSGFEKKNIDISTGVEDESNENLNINDGYIVDTGDYLNTYVLEMVDEYGDAIYIKSGDFDMLIDSGQYADGANVFSMLQEHCTDNILDVLIATHGHGDHVAGFGNNALGSIDNVNLIIDYGYVDNNNYKYEDIRDSYIQKGADYYTAYDCVRYRNGAQKKYKFSEDLYLEVLDTDQYAYKNQVLTSEEYDAENDFSVVVKLTFKSNTYLLTGDLAGALENKFTNALKEEDVKDITVYKAAHHGATSYSSNNRELLNYLNPEICVSSAAIINQYKPTDHSSSGQTVYQHPRPAFVRNILNTSKIKLTKNYYFNGTMGTIHIKDDGTNIPIVTGLGPTRGYYDSKGNKVTGENNKKFYETVMYNSYYLS